MKAFCDFFFNCTVCRVHYFYELATYPTGGVFLLFTPPPGSCVRRFGWSQYMHVGLFWFAFRVVEVLSGDELRDELRFLPWYCGVRASGNERSLERTGSVTGKVVLCSGLVDEGRAGLSQEIHGTSFSYYLSVPHITGILS